jgi:hypothetical protein
MLKIPPSRRPSIIVAGIMSVATPFRLASQTIPARVIAPRDAVLGEVFSGLALSPIRELRDGRVIVAENGSPPPRLMVADFQANTVTPIGRKGPGPDEYEIAASMDALAGDSTLLRAGQYRWTVLDGARIATTSKPDDRAVLVARGIVLGADTLGFVLTYVPRRPGDDSISIALVSRQTGAMTAVARLAVRAEPGYPPPPDTQAGRIRPARGAWKAQEVAHLFPDGWVAIARLNPYRVDWRSPDGRWIFGSPLPVSIVNVDEREKRARGSSH